MAMSDYESAWNEETATAAGKALAAVPEDDYLAAWKADEPAPSLADRLAAGEGEKVAQASNLMEDTRGMAPNAKEAYRKAMGVEPEAKPVPPPVVANVASGPSGQRVLTRKDLDAQIQIAIDRKMAPDRKTAEKLIVDDKRKRGYLVEGY